MKLAAIVISFGYTNEELYNNVKNYLSDVDLMIIWDNTPLERKKISKDFWMDVDSKIKMLGTGNNEGIGYALNKAIEMAERNKCTHLLMMDQDSIWRNFNEYRKKIELTKEKDIALYAPTIADAGSDFVFSCNKSDLYAITSGSVLDLSYVSSIGLFNERFFIDEVDNEYCIRAVLNGYHIKVFGDILLYQHFGTKDGKSFLAKQTANYSPFRTFHQVRNRIWMGRMYFRQLTWRYHARTILLTILKRTVIVLLYERDKNLKLKAILNGLWDGITKSPTK